MQAFRFNQRDLVANREGHITKTHGRKILERELWDRDSHIMRTILPFIIILILPALVCILSGFTVIEFAMSDSPIPEGAIQVMLGSLVIILICVVGIYFITRSLFRDVNQGEVVTIQGLAIVDNNPKSPSLTVNNVNLRLNRKALITLKHMEPYVFHCLPKSKVVVSVEAMQR